MFPKNIGWIDARKPNTPIDSSKVEIEELEQTLGTFSEKMLMGIGFKYGKDSREYEMAGGVRKSERIRKSRATRLKTVAQKASSQGTQPS
ncbi:MULTISPECIES: hypothetical protein [unclassified Nostoc]|uniref:hypothetical protein n=1 Tax=unclassified Nostoc TaxID=2593658 RepID=UPI0026840B10